VIYTSKYSKHTIANPIALTKDVKWLGLGVGLVLGTEGVPAHARAVPAKAFQLGEGHRQWGVVLVPNDVIISVICRTVVQAESSCYVARHPTA